MTGPSLPARAKAPTDADRFDEVLHHAASLDAVPIDRVRASIGRHGVACVRGLFAPQAMREVWERMSRAFDASADRKHDPADTEAVRRNFQKLQIGANSGTSTRRTLGRFMRVFYNPIFAPDVHGMRPHFTRLARLRNRLYGLEDDFAVDRDQDGFWTCARIQQYPRGGGFMVPHRDMYSQIATVESDLGYYQILLLLTEPGRDFDEGGAYVEVDGERFAYERFCRSGDVAIYDGSSVHGVADIDPMAPLEMDRLGGRGVAIASLFKRLTPGARDYAGLAERAADQLGEPDRDRPTSRSKRDD